MMFFGQEMLDRRRAVAIAFGHGRQEAIFVRWSKNYSWLGKGKNVDRVGQLRREKIEMEGWSASMAPHNDGTVSNSLQNVCMGE